MCCDSDNVLCIDTTFNLCSSWATDCCYNNDGLRTNEGKHPIFLGQAIVHFEKDVFLFSRFSSEMLAYQPAISNLQTIGTDIEKAKRFSLSNQRSKTAAMCFSTERRKKANRTQTQF